MPARQLGQSYEPYRVAVGCSRLRWMVISLVWAVAKQLVCSARCTKLAVALCCKVPHKWGVSFGTWQSCANCGWQPFGPARPPARGWLFFVPLLGRRGGHTQFYTKEEGRSKKEDRSENKEIRMKRTYEKYIYIYIYICRHPYSVLIDDL